MTFIRSILVLTAVCLCVGFSYFFGHALAVHSMTPVFLGAVLLLVGAGVIVMLNRRDRQRNPNRLDRQGWV